ncbi:hypothetical protein ACFXPH_31630, partial [Streptomyces goshikiensis]
MTSGPEDRPGGADPAERAAAAAGRRTRASSRTDGHPARPAVGRATRGPADGLATPGGRGGPWAGDAPGRRRGGKTPARPAPAG